MWSISISAMNGSTVYAELSFFVPEGGIHHDFGEILPVYPEGYLEVKRDEEGASFGPIHRIP